MVEVTNELLFQTLVGLRADIGSMREEAREFRTELRQQTGVLARRLDAVEARLTHVERTLEAHTIAIERLDRKFDIVVAALEPMLPDEARRALAH